MKRGGTLNGGGPAAGRVRRGGPFATWNADALQQVALVLCR